MKRGPKPVSHTKAHAWVIAQGLTVAEFASRAGVHFTLAHRHLSGRGPVSRRIHAEYVRVFPKGPWRVGLLDALTNPKPLTAKSSRGRIWA